MATGRKHCGWCATASEPDGDGGRVHDDGTGQCMSLPVSASGDRQAEVPATAWLTEATDGTVALRLVADVDLTPERAREWLAEVGKMLDGVG